MNPDMPGYVGYRPRVDLSPRLIVLLAIGGAALWTIIIFAIWKIWP